MKQKFGLLILIIVIVGIGISVWKDIKSTKKSQTTKKMGSILAKEVIVILDKDEFYPKEVTVKTGTAVRWKNISGKPQTVNSDTYPTNKLHKELNFGVFNSGSSVIYIFTKPGTYGYHNQFHHEQTGKIIVSE